MGELTREQLEVEPLKGMNEMEKVGTSLPMILKRKFLSDIAMDQ